MSKRSIKGMTIINPFFKYRLELGFTQAEMSQLARVTIQVIHKHEYGAINVVSAKVATVFVERIAGVTYDSLAAEYIDWRLRQRQNTHIALNYSLDGLPERQGAVGVKAEHPLLAVLNNEGLGLSTIAICKRLALHPAILVRYTRGIQKTLPISIEICLQDIGLTDQQIIEIIQAGQRWEYSGRQKAKAIRNNNIASNLGLIDNNE